ncbi:glycosyltransferase [Novosphingobium resinovorum]|uniref:Glycosyl transferase n=1 Tax=Novosphingobium resinovorum TaxID=158500 RepID=A0A031JYP8_9SPHN|nr:MULTISPECIES: glycosyltransferase [Novosphingobium]AOR78981.1 glycosyl transferase [Novosphingobium resinovorum]EZP82831.1 Group 1 glycosyl transferase [Novosphingobium resinovorum]MBF7014524.1 glycosyltransferase [Novosphingobium sp. HR1a]WJM24996.1 glycosyltransferase [Novosphingobium resinovorum]
MTLNLAEPPMAGRHTRFSEPRVAIVHYWLVSMRGGERVLERLLGLFPGADVFTHVYDESRMSESIRKANVTTTWINGLPFSRRLYQYYLPLMPMALEHLDLTGYDLVISSESGPAKGVITSPHAQHLCYCHSPMRYLWDHYHLYRKDANPIARAAMPLIYHRMRQWDMSSSARVDTIVANSSFIRERVRKFWRRESEVIHPPVDTRIFTPSLDVDDHYLWVGQMVPYKRPDLAVEAFNRTGLPLLMVGDGGMLARLKRVAGPNIRFVSRLGFNELRQAYARARGLVFTAEEDFGIVPVEAMASGRPVLAYGRGGVLDSVVPGETGLFFERQTADSLVDGIERFERWLPEFDPSVAVAQSNRFAPEHFDRKILTAVGQLS